MPDKVLHFVSLSSSCMDYGARMNRRSSSAENLPIATVRYDRNFCCIYASPAYLQFIVSQAREILGKSVEEIWWPTNISANAYRMQLEDVMLTGRESEVTLEWRDGDGRLVSYIEKLMPDYDVAGEIVGVSVLVIDISAFRQWQLVESERQRVYERLAHGDDLKSILEQVASYVESAMPWAYCSILVFDEEQKCLQTVAAPSIPDTLKASANLDVLANEPGCCGGWQIFASQAETGMIRDQFYHECSNSCPGYAREMAVSACWFEPIISSVKQMLGLVRLYLRESVVPDQDDRALLGKAIYLSSLSIERKRYEQQIYDQACYDSLTNLPNRRSINNRLREEIIKAERGKHGVAVLFIDLDRFKDVNDGFGHATGDLLLIEATHRIRSCVRESDTVGRLGGDEFVIILPQIGDCKLMERVAHDIVSIMQRPFHQGQHRITISASVGIALYPRDAADADSLIKHADQAMYSAKDIGRNTYSLGLDLSSEVDAMDDQASPDR